MSGLIGDVVTAGSPIDVAKIRELSRKGLRGCSPMDRFYAWMVLLEILKGDLDAWTVKQKALLERYRAFVEDSGMVQWHKHWIPHVNLMPFGVGEESLMDMIHGDIIRTGRILRFLPVKRIEGHEAETDDTLFDFQEHMRRLERALYVFVQASRGEFCYLQGFNELIAPFYCIAVDATGDLDLAECLSYYCLRKILKKFRLIEFFAGHRETEHVLSSFEFLQELQKKHLPKVYELLEEQGIVPIYYALRWFTLMFAQEYDLQDLLVVWDALLSHTDDFVHFLAYMGLAHLKTTEDKLTDVYADNIWQLQHVTGDIDVDAVIEYANNVYDEDKQAESKGWVRSIIGYITFGYL